MKYAGSAQGRIFSPFHRCGLLGTGAVLILIVLSANTAQAITAPTEVVQRIVITGTRPKIATYWGPFQQYTTAKSNFSLGSWVSEDEYLDARNEVIMYGWKWPMTKDKIATALRDVRCNPATAFSSAATLTSTLLPEVRRGAAIAIFHNVRFVELYKPGSIFKVFWADGGSSEYPVIGGFGSIALGDEGKTTVGSGAVEPSSNCPRA